MNISISREASAARTIQARVRGHQLRNQQLLEAAESGDIFEPLPFVIKLLLYYVLESTKVLFLTHNRDYHLYFLLKYY
ncbi:hypothetical protein CL657_04400 [bacterium]|nr:hypothetical protein [bacterium]|tara:strand:- start:406 stop:639 length:234 start_codon:yes stop_codon:yes gene_type:complete